MGSFGPMRLETGNPELSVRRRSTSGRTPTLLLGTTDMVFIDAPGTGYSRALGDAKGSDFYGVDQDADAFARAIIRYVTKFSRWDSPSSCSAKATEPRDRERSPISCRIAGWRSTASSCCRRS